MGHMIKALLQPHVCVKRKAVYSSAAQGLLMHVGSCRALQFNHTAMCIADELPLGKSGWHCN